MWPAAWTRTSKLLGRLAGVRPSTRSGEDVRSSSARYSAGAAGESKSQIRRKRVVAIGALSLAGGVALSAINDLAIFHGCTTKALDKATDNPEVVQAIGLPIARGPWYDASVVLGHRRRSVSCTFPVTGPRGSGVFHIEAIRNGADGVLSFLRHHDWEILAMDARLELQALPSDDDGHQRQPLVMNLNLMTSATHNDDNECKTSSTAGGGEIS